MKEEREVGCYANRCIGPARCQGGDEQEIAISDIEEILYLLGFVAMESQSSTWNFLKDGSILKKMLYLWYTPGMSDVTTEERYEEKQEA